MAVIIIVANLHVPDPVALARFYRDVFELGLALDMGWIAFLSRDTTHKIELHTASDEGHGADLLAISIGVEDLSATDLAVRGAGPEAVYRPVKESWGPRRSLFRDPAGNFVNVVDS